MLSIENPQPDPLLNSNSDERASASDHRPPQELLQLPNSLDHHPSFSIRDYVFTARSKDIKKNWPFSLKNLQLCLKHGVKELLPPLEPLDTESRKSLKRCMVESSSVDKEKTSNHDDPQLNHKLKESCFDISSCKSGDENDFPSTTTSVSHSIESLTVNRLSTATAAGFSGNIKNKTENALRPLSKKCRLIVKFGGNSDRSSTEDIASTSTTVSETMASKVCPVCKTFSSSSNTTLNAHIDQCLSMESTPKWTSDTKLTRHRIKPRKTRLMVDIYTTALPCTLEELDRRNGTSWAAISCLPAQESEATGNVEAINEGKKVKVSQVHPEDIGDVGPVYIDANGTKLRILSKFNDQPSVSKVREDIEARKLQKGDKGGKFISKKKKKLLAQKHHKFLKVAPERKMNFSKNVEEECEGEAKSCEKEHTVSNQTKPSDSVTLRPWVCSKRRGFSKKTGQVGSQPVRCNWHLPQDLLAYNDQSFLGATRMDRDVVQKSTDFSENSLSSAAKNDKIEKSFRKVRGSKKREQSPGRKRTGNLLVKPTSIQSGNHGTSLSDSHTTRPPDSTWNGSSLLRKRTFDASGTADIANKKPSCDANGKKLQFSTLRKNMSCMNGRSSVTDTVLGRVKKLSALKKSHLRFMKKRNEEGVSEKGQEYDFKRRKQDERDEIADDSLEMDTVFEPRPGNGIFSVSEGVDGPSPNFYDRNDDDFLQKVDGLDSVGNQVRVYVDDIVGQPSSNERSAAGSIKSIDSEIYELSNSLNAQHDHSLESAEDYRRLLCGTEAPPAPTELDYVHAQDMFSADEIGSASRIAAELDPKGGHGHSFPEVDPILIPGPPGSFLPSPRDMGSEDFQGNNSSLTTSRVHSSLDVVDGDSSDSPMSAASTISNSTANRCDFKYSEPSSSVVPYDFKYSEPSSSVGPYENIKSAGASVESSLQSVDTIPQASSAEVERSGFHGGYSKVDDDRIYLDKGSLGFKNDQPCCCQRKERLSQAAALNFQESQLLRRRKMASMTVPTGGKVKDFNPNLSLRSANLDVRSELAPPSCYPYPRSDKMALPVTKPLAGTISFRDSANAAVMKPVVRGDCGFGSPSPSASNPVLRLMGKNLLVVNKDDDLTVGVGGVQSQTQNNPHNTSQFLAFTEVSPGNIHLGSQVSQYYEGGYGIDSGSRFPVNGQVPAGMYRDQQHIDYSFAGRQNSAKEIIILDDENAVIENAEKYGDGGRESQSVPKYNNPNPDFVHPFSCYQSQDHHHPPALNGNYHTTQSKRSPFTAAAEAASSPGHIRSTALHYPPGFS